eukprot:Tamp_04743.p3 GENE.Tamp_04743~~Tamp_04743.p3  ORF type:complete len:156 (+),score=22.79 Tamp_04743:1866-2333(+)
MKIYKDDATSGSLSRRMEELVLASVGTVVVKTAVSVATGLTRRGPATRAAAARTRRVDSVLYVVLLVAQLGSAQAYGCTEDSHCKYGNCDNNGHCVSDPERALRRRVRSTQSDCVECGSAGCSTTRSNPEVIFLCTAFAPSLFIDLLWRVLESDD